MSKKKKKFYVVWKGHKPGIYSSWEACKKQLKDFKGAIYKSFPDKKSAEEAFRSDFKKYIGKKAFVSKLSKEELRRIGQPNPQSICVDAAVGGNPGKLEYRGVDTKTGKQLFKQGPFDKGTNNIGEFLAIVHGLAYLQKRKDPRFIYSDSRTAMAWVRRKHCNTKLEEDASNERLFELIDRAETWLKNNTYQTKIVKWETKAWGEIPADFGRK